MKKVPVYVYNQSSNKLPAYETTLAAGMDVRADFSRITETNLLKTKGECEFIFEAGVEEQVYVYYPVKRILINLENTKQIGWNLNFANLILRNE